ncbi:MAG: NAD(P)-dependent oxidoreductase [Acidobacteriota bacterium]
MKVGFIGLGIMGKPMALNLVKAGFELVVYNRTRARSDELASESVAVAASPADVARQCEIVIVIVTDSDAVRDVVAGPNGVLDGVREGGVVIDMSTIAPAVERELAEKLGQRSAFLIDAPVSGGDVGAQKGTLAIMAGGRREAFDRVRPIFEAMGKTITYCGPEGNGQVTKLCNQILVSVNLLAVSEALAFAARNGLDRKVMIEAIQGGAAGSWQLSNLGPKIVDRDFAPGFMIDLMQKDLRLVLEAADQVKATLPATACVHQLFNAAQNRDWGRDGTQALARIVELLSSV